MVKNRGLWSIQWFWSRILIKVRCIFPLKDQRAMMRRCSVRCLAPPYDDAQMLRTMLRKSSPWVINGSSIDLHCFSIPEALGHYWEIFSINEFVVCNAKWNYKHYQLHSHCIMRHTTADWGAVQACRWLAHRQVTLHVKVRHTRNDSWLTVIIGLATDSACNIRNQSNGIWNIHNWTSGIDLRGFSII